MLDHFLETFQARICVSALPDAAPEGEAARRVCPDTVFQTLRCGILVRDIDGMVVEHNAAAERLLGLSSAQIRGRAPLEPGWRMVQVDSRELPLEQTPTRLTLRDGKPRHGVVIGVVAVPSEVRWFCFHSDPLKDASGNLLAAVATFFDVTEIALQIPEIGPSPAGGATSPRPTLAAIARRMEISTATVSMALRNHPRISAEMRAKVKTVADELGYRVDPHVQRAMARIRRGSQATPKANLCALGDPYSYTNPFVAALLAAARLRADQLGYGFAMERLDRLQLEPLALTRMLTHRGVDGLLLLPRSMPWSCDELLAWPRFSAVAVGHCVRSPDFDRVTVDWFSSVQGTCAELAERGYRRIGAVIDSRLDELCGRRLVTSLAGIHVHLPLEPVALLRYRTIEGQLPTHDPRNALPTVIADQTSRRVFPAQWEDFCQRLRDWHRRERPDALLIDNEGTALAIVDALDPSAVAELGIVVLNRRGDSQFAGWEERPAKIGEMAIDLLDTKVRHTEHGAPATPTLRAVKGLWRDGASLRPKPTTSLVNASEDQLLPAVDAPTSIAAPPKAAQLSDEGAAGE